MSGLPKDQRYNELHNDLEGNPLYAEYTDGYIGVQGIHFQDGTTQITAGGAGGSPGGSDTQIQFNDDGSFGGDSRLTFDKTTGILVMPNEAPWGPSGVESFEAFSSDSQAITITGASPYSLSSNLIIVQAPYSGTVDKSGGAVFAFNFGNSGPHNVSNTLGFDIAALNTGGGTLDGVTAMDFTPGGTNYTAINIEAGADPTQTTPIAAQGGVSYFKDGFRLANQSTGPIWKSGANTPEGAVTAVVGSLYTRTNGGANTTLYVKESGSGNTGWVAK